MNSFASKVGWVLVVAAVVSNIILASKLEDARDDAVRATRETNRVVAAYIDELETRYVKSCNIERPSQPTASETFCLNGARQKASEVAVRARQ